MHRDEAGREGGGEQHQTKLSHQRRPESRVHQAHFRQTHYRQTPTQQCSQIEFYGLICKLPIKAQHTGETDGPILIEK